MEAICKSCRNKLTTLMDMLWEGPVIQTIAQTGQLASMTVLQEFVMKTGLTRWPSCFFLRIRQKIDRLRQQCFSSITKGILQEIHLRIICVKCY